MNRLELLKNINSTYWGHYGYQGLFFISIAIIIAYKNKSKSGVVLVCLSTIVFLFSCLSFFIKPLEKFLNKVNIDIESLYNRTFFIIPVFLVIAYGLVLLLDELDGKKMVVFSIVFLVVIVMNGNFIYGGTKFVKADNFYKIPNDVIQMSDICNCGEPVNIIVPRDMISYVEIYDESICIPYGEDDDIYLGEQLISENPDVKFVLQYIMKWDIKYIVVKNVGDVEEKYANCGFETMGYTDRYMVLKLNYPK